VVGGGSGDGGDDGGCGAGVARPDLVRALTHVNRGQEPSSEASIAGGRGGFVLSSKDVHEGESARWCACRCKGRAAAVVVGGGGAGAVDAAGGEREGEGMLWGWGRTRCTIAKGRIGLFARPSPYGILEAKKLKRGRPSGIPRDDAFIYLLHSTHPNGPNHATQPTTATQIRGTLGVGDTSKMTQFYSLGCLIITNKAQDFRSLFRSHSVMQLLPSPPLPRMRPQKKSRFLLIKHAHTI
jgi:hypothetical protein